MFQKNQDVGVSSKMAIPALISAAAIRRLARATGQTVAEAQLDILAELFLGTRPEAVCGKIVNENNGFARDRIREISIEGDFETPDAAAVFVARFALNLEGEDDSLGDAPDAAIPDLGFRTAAELAEIAGTDESTIRAREDALLGRIESAKTDSFGLGDREERIALADSTLSALRAPPSGRGRKPLAARREGRDGE